jgi:serine/threonine-protein kinase
MAIERLGPYRIEKLLGRGGMGAVYAGVNPKTGERAAIKVLAAHLSDNSDFRERFASEVETLKKLRHPNIVQLLAWGEEDEHLFYAMELIDGRSLQDEMQSGRRYHWREVAKIGVEVCRALKHAHDSGVIHRDLKPANLLIDSQNQIKLTDFGIAKLYGGTQITAAGGILGTADYMSPEQAEGKPVNARSDLYSLGSVLYALLVGHPPFASKSLPEVIHNLRNEKPTPVRRLAPETPEAFESIIQQLLEKDPARRVASAFAIGNYLRAMDHALSLETRVGEAPPQELPPDQPATPHTLSKAGTDATIVTSGGAPAPSPSSPTKVGGGATAFIKPGEPHSEIRLDSAQIATHVPRAATQADPAPATSAAEPAAAKTRFVTMEEEENLRKRRERKSEEGPQQWLALAGMTAVVVVLGAGVVYALLPPSADTLYRRVMTAADTNDLDQLQVVDGDIRQFLQRFPSDARADEMDQYRQRLDTARLERQSQFKVRTGGSGSLPVQRAYLEAMRLKETDPERALLQFSAIVAVFEGARGGSDEEAQANRDYVKLASKQIPELRDSLQEATETQTRMIAARIDEAQKLQTDSPQAAEKILRGIIDLYGDKPWASEQVERARLQLAKADGSTE